MQALGRGDEALTRYQASLAIRERLAAGEPDRADYQRDLSISCERLASATDNPSDVRAWQMRGIDIHRRLIQGDPARTDLVVELAVKLLNLASTSEEPTIDLREIVSLLEPLDVTGHLDLRGQQLLENTKAALGQ